ncbi:MAG: ATP-binding protein [Myxococcota bacterium]|jgi:PAS domain S-box-containing protein|nr:ATP-binding protein [Myxococcota bacterium]
MTSLVFLFSAAFVINTMVWTSVLAKHTAHSLNRSFLLLVGCSIVWCLVGLIIFIPEMVKYEEYLIKLTTVIQILWAGLFLHFVYRVMDRKIDIIFEFFLAIATVGSLLALLTDNVVSGITRNEYAVTLIPGPWAVYAAIPPCSTMLVGWYLLGKGILRHEDSLKRKILILVFVGPICQAILSLFTLVLLPVFLHVNTVPNLLAPATVICSLILYVAVARYNFMNVSVEQLAKETFEDTNEGIILTSPQGHITRINKGGLNLLGLPKNKVIGCPILDVFQGEHFTNSFAHKEICIQQGEKIRTFYLTRSIVTKGDLKLGTVILFQDITAQKNAENELKQSRDDLEKEVEKRTHELQQAQKLAAIGVLSGSIAHDFNNLLAAIIGFTDSARDELPKSSLAYSDLREVLEAADRARDIVRRILSIGCIENRDYKEFNALRVISEYLQVARETTSKDISFVSNLHEKPIFVTGDPTQLHQVLMNLVTNAAHAIGGKKEGISITVDMVSLDKAFTQNHPPLTPGLHLKIVVADTGCGMEEKILKKIFDPFFTTKEEGVGTGLGLPSVLGIVRNHGGAIQVQSKPGVGTAFTIHLPARIGEDLEKRESNNPPAISGKGSILFVDDDEQLGRAGERMLCPLGYQVTSVCQGEAALQLLRESPAEFDLLITDHLMPGMTGISLAEQVRQICPELPIILFSGQTDPLLTEQAAAAGISKFLYKPVSRKKLAGAVHALLSTSERQSRLKGLER